MKLIVISKTAEKGGFNAYVYGKHPVVQCFAETEILALAGLVEKLIKKNPKWIVKKDSK